MGSNALIGICVALGGLGAWNTWTLYQINQRLDKIELQDSVSTSAKTLEREKKAGHINLDSKQKMMDETIKRKKSRFFSKRKSKDERLDSSQASIDLTDPDLQEAIAQIAESNAQKKEEQRRRSKMEAYKTSLRHELEQFSAEKEYESDTVKSIESILDESTAEWTAVRQQVREGEISWMDARTEFKAIGDETEAKVTEFISSEDYTELRSRLWGDWGR